jgi:hypothetical protein
MQGGYVSTGADQRCTLGVLHFTVAIQLERKARCPKPKLLAIAATLNAILFAASVAFARGDMLPVILISILFNLAQLGAKPVGQPVPRAGIWRQGATMRAAEPRSATAPCQVKSHHLLRFGPHAAVGHVVCTNRTNRGRLTNPLIGVDRK